MQGRLYCPILQIGKLRLLEIMELILGHTGYREADEVWLEALASRVKKSIYIVCLSLSPPRHSSSKLPDRLLGLSQSVWSSPVPNSPRKIQVVGRPDKCRSLDLGVGDSGVRDH